MKFCFLFLLSINFSSNFIFPQNIYKKNFAEVIPGEEYSRSGFYTFLFGNGWRDLWTTPIKVETLNLKYFDGGISPVKKITDSDSKSLLLKSRGEYWIFNSLFKDPQKIFPKDILENAVNNILKDQISSLNPMTPLLNNVLINAIDSANIKSFLVRLPDDSSLGKFRDEFRGLTGILESKNKYSGEDSPRVITTYNLLNLIDSKVYQKVDSKKFLKERLFDIFVGDWNRGADKWSWKLDLDRNNAFWVPIPKDRNLAFSKFDGVVPKTAIEIIPELNSFGNDYPEIEKLTWSGRFLDRRFLTGIDRHSWDSVTNSLVNKLSDSTIQKATNALPPECFNLAGKELYKDLISRRDNLKKISEDYYESINKVADIYASGADDSLKVIRINNNLTKVILCMRNKGVIENLTYFNKVFENNITNEIRIYLGNGNDKAVVKGKVDSSPLIRIIGGEGDDVLIDSSIVHGYLFSFTPVHCPDVKTEFYDSDKNTEFISGKSTYINKNQYSLPSTQKEKYEPEQQDRGHEWLIIPELSYDANNGLVFGGGPLFYKYDFRMTPYKYRMSFTASYATRSRTLNIFYNGDFYSWIKNAKVHLNFRKSELELIKFFGFGNETAYNSSLDSKDYYRLIQKLVGFYPSIFYGFSDNFSGSIGLSFENSDIVLSNSEILLKDFPYGRYGIGRFNFAGLNSSFEFNSGDEINNTFKGYHLRVAGEYFPKLLDNRNSFARSNFDVRAFFTGNIITQTTFALRTGGEKVWGKFPLFKSVFMGGDSHLLGYSRQRFAGNGSIYSQMELRFLIKELDLILKGNLGMSIFSETGRVFTSNQHSEKWHSSYGFGFWSSILQRRINLSLTFAFSPETFSLYADTKFLF